MHRQGETELFDACPICKEEVREYQRVNVREGVWFTCCPACFKGIRLFMQNKTKRARGAAPPHPAVRNRRGRRRL